MITYLFGAGASARAVPVVKEIPGEIERLVEKLYDGRNYPNEAFIRRKDEWFHDPAFALPFHSDSNFPIRNEFKLALLRLKESIGNSASIDTVAKGFSISGNKDYEWFKHLIVLWLTLTQRFNKPDPRYELFLATIIEKVQKGLPSEKVNLLSWNYDMQMEIAFSKFLNNGNNIIEAATALGIASRHNYVVPGRRPKDYKPVIFKINGSCSYQTDQPGKPFLYPAAVFDGSPTKQFLLEVWENFKLSRPVDLCFAWEEDSFQEEEFEFYLSKIRKSKALVIIGYSFPNFNRKVDKRILDSAREGDLKIYIQDMNPETIANKLNMDFGLSLNKISAVDKVNLDEFYIPSEYHSL